MVASSGFVYIYTASLVLGKFMEGREGGGADIVIGMSLFFYLRGGGSERGIALMSIEKRSLAQILE
ncbi:hypothetical protein TCA2_4882 [Paenibacillus sp. TCA20]|nr:hypothetical protein TCA2_4882 [Paenibacillus sp. TCA20]